MLSMDAATLNDLVWCHLGVSSDPHRVGLVLDYRGDQPPLELFEALRRYGWSTPAPHSPPAKAIDWDHPDPESGRRWSLRPFLVERALAVPGGAAPEWACTEAWLETTLEGFGLRLSGERVDVGALREARQGRAEMVFDEVDAPVDPFKPATERVNVTPLASITPSPESPGVHLEPLRSAETADRVAALSRPPAPSKPTPMLDLVLGGATPAVDPVAEREESPIARPASPSGPVSARPAIDMVEAPTAPPAPEAPSPTADASRAPLMWTAADPVLHQRAVCAVIRRGVVGKVIDLLHELELEEGAAVFPVVGHGRGGGRVTRYRGRESVEPLNRIQIVVPVDPSLVDSLVDRLVEAARVGQKGDGKIWVC